MATIKVVSIIARAQTLLKDATGTRWPVLELQDCLNESYREIVSLQPDANTEVGTFVCAAGYRQTLETNYPYAYKLLEVISNKATTSNKKFVKLVSRSSMDSMVPDWYSQTSSVNIEKYMFDKRVPKDFLVYPPATVDARLEIIYSNVPLPHTLTKAQLETAATTEVIRIDDIYASPILDYVLYRAYSKDSEQPNNASRAMAHYQAMVASLGAKIQSDGSTAPGGS